VRGISKGLCAAAPRRGECASQIAISQALFDFRASNELTKEAGIETVESGPCQPTTRKLKSGFGKPPTNLGPIPNSNRRSIRSRCWAHLPALCGSEVRGGGKETNGSGERTPEDRQDRLSGAGCPLPTRKGSVLRTC
jgi:hypothetical protein